jgi:biopolymer transport protein ExbD
MAFSASNGGQTSRARRSVSVGTLSEMNVVPLVDVVLVLLIIFMITAQAMQSGLNIEVPQVKEVKETVEDLPIVEVTRTGKLYLNDKPININELGTEISTRFPSQKSVYVEADKRALWDIPVQVMSALRDAHLGIQVVVKQMELPKP